MSSPSVGSDKETPTEKARPNIDAIDQEIIRILQSDGRASFTSIAKQLDISDGAVRNRVGALTASRVLKVIAVVDPIALGYDAYALIGIKVSSGCDPHEAASYFAGLDEVTYVCFVAGRYDICIEVVCETHEKLALFLRHHCYSQPTVSAVEPMVGLTMYKSMMKWGRP